MANVDLVMRLLAEDRASDKFKKVADSTDLASKRMDRFKRVASTVSAAAIIGFAASSVKAFAEAEAQQSKLEGAYKRFPKVTDVPIGALRSLNSELQRTTKYDDDAVAGAQAVLAQFNLTGQQIKAVTPLLLDYASATGKDVTSAAQDLGKAMLGNAKALKAIGVNFKSTGDTAKDFDTIMAALKTKVGGFATEEGKTASGQLAILSNQFGDLQESVGGALVPALTSLVNIVKPLAEGFNGLPDSMKTSVVLTGGLAAAAVVLVPKIVAAKVALVELGIASKVANGGLKSTAMSLGKVGLALAAVEFAKAASEGSDAINGNTRDMSALLTQIGKTGKGFDDLGYTVDGVTTYTQDFNNAIMRSQAPDLLDKIGQGLGSLTGMKDDLTLATDSVKGVDDSLAAMVGSGHLGDAQKAVAELRQRFVDAGGSVEQFDAALPGYQQALLGTISPMQRLDIATYGVKKSADAVDIAWKKLEGTLSKQEAADSAIQSFKDLAKSLGDNGRSFTGNSEKALANRAALRAAIKATEDHVAALGKGPAAAKAYSDDVAALRATLAKSKLSKKEQDALLAPLLAMKSTVENFTKSKTLNIKIKPVVDGSGRLIWHPAGGGTALVGDVEYRAKGGPVMAGRPYVVGEHRAELFVPRTSGTILPSVPGDGGVGTANVNVYLDSRLVQTSLVDLKRQQGGRLHF